MSTKTTGTPKIEANLACFSVKGADVTITTPHWYPGERVEVPIASLRAFLDQYDSAMDGLRNGLTGACDDLEAEVKVRYGQDRSQRWMIESEKRRYLRDLEGVDAFREPAKKLPPAAE